MRWLDAITGTKTNDAYGVCVLKDAPAALAAPVSAFKPHVDQSACTVTAILTTRTPDRQGDIVDPAGGDFSEHQTNPVVMFHHGKTHKLPIGKAEDRDGNYTVRLVKAQDGDVLLGTTHFAQSNRFAQDVFGLVAEDVLRGVSIGFDPAEDDDAAEQLGPVCPILNRPPLHFKSWKLLEYSHTPLGVNRDALTVAVHKSLDGSRPLDPRLLKMLEPFAAPRRTTAAGGAAAEKGVVGRAIKKVVGTRTTRTAAAGDPGATDVQTRVMSMVKPTLPGAKAVTNRKIVGTPQPTETKAMDDDEEDTPGADPTDDADAGADQSAAGGDYDPTTDDPGDDPALPANASPYGGTGGDDTPPPTVQTLKDAAQGLLDLCAAIEGAMKKSEHMKGRKYAAKLCADLKSTAGEASGFADKIHGELSGAPMDADQSTDTDSDGDVPESDEEASEGAAGDAGDEGGEGEGAPPPKKEPETDDDGAIVTKGFNYVTRRWTFADLAAAEQPAPAAVAPSADAKQLKALRRENESLKKTLEGLLVDVEAGQNRGR